MARPPYALDPGRPFCYHYLRITDCMASGTSHARTLLLTGSPGTGKTTVVRAAVARLPGWRVAGFTTEELRAGGRRVGFRGTTLDGHEVIIAHVSFPGHPRVGRYGVDVAAIDSLAASLAPGLDADAYLIDEIGKMECLSAAFVSAVRLLLASPVRTVATVAAAGAGLIAEVKARPDVTLWEVTRANRSSLPAEVAAWLEATR
jgi:nucleoside-triphosphatase